jgi:putative peptide zinc metalloprotease protein
VKSLHELGHALTCKYFGGECHSLGIMFLLFTPALYCDVSDAWMFPERWKRMAVSAAGILVEVALASLALLLWSATLPGWFNTLLFNIVLVCSAGTLLINGNPLLRYDGYFVFADLIGAPNLREQADARLRKLLAWWMAGVELDEPRLLAEPRWGLLIGYGVLSLAYRWLMIGGILWLLHVILKPHGLSILATAVAVIIVASQIAGPGLRIGRFIADPMQRSKVKGPRLAMSCLILLVIAALVLAIPLPRRVHAPLVIQPAGAQQIFVNTPGVLERAPTPGEKVRSGEVLATLRNRRLELEIADLAAKTSLQKLTVEQLQIRRHAEPALADGIPVAIEALKDLEAQLKQKQQQQSELTLRASSGGTILPPQRKRQHDSSDELRDYAGSPLDEPNRGCYLETGTLLCSVGETDDVEALVIIHESEVPLVAAGQRVRLALSEVPGGILTGEVVAVARRNARDLPQELVAQGEFASERRPDGTIRPQGRYYEATVRIDGEHPPLLSGATGQAKIIVQREALGLRLYRALRGTFRWPI